MGRFVSKHLKNRVQRYTVKTMQRCQRSFTRGSIATHHDISIELRNANAKIYEPCLLMDKVFDNLIVPTKINSFSCMSVTFYAFYL